MEYILTIILAVFDRTSLSYFLSGFFDVKNKKTYPFYSIITFLIYLSFMMFFTTAAGRWLEQFKLPIILLTMYIYSSLCFEGSTYLKILLNFVYLIILYAVDFIQMSVTALLGLAPTVILYNVTLFCIFSFINKFLAMSIFFFLKKYISSRRKNIQIPRNQWIQVFIYSAVTLSALIMLGYNILDSDKADPFLIFFSAIIVLANILLFSLISKLDEENQTRQQNALLNQQIRIGMENVTALQQAYSRQRSMTHDFNNHLTVIRSLLVSGETQQAALYTDRLLNTSISVSRLFESGNSVVDTLLTRKYSQAKAMDINMQVFIDDLTQLAVPSEELVVILSNLLDNAIDACEKCTGEKLIKVKFSKEDENYILSVHNTAANISPNLSTTKEDSLNHGFGLKNIISVLDKYSYPYLIDTSDNWFKFTALLG
ncbi:MAG: sensor histidine kinase [Oscillospiraceae bacterium]|nr:sensor histidine kinase [Oscillospiraceae bacterium]